VVQYNKRDMPEVMPVESLRAELNPTGVPDFRGGGIAGHRRV
jgi:hypothetical protein